MSYKELLDDLVKERALLLRGRVDTEMQKLLCSAIEMLNRQGTDPIKLQIDSDGGRSMTGAFIFDSIRFSEAPVHALVTGSARSVAFKILQACDLRLAYPHSAFMFHGSTGSDVRIDAPDFEYDVANFRRFHNSYLRFLARRSEQPLGQIRKWSREERYFPAQEALELGFIDKILRPPRKQ